MSFLKSSATGLPQSTAMPMKWFYFLIWCNLFLTAFMNVSAAVQLFDEYKIVSASVAHGTLLAAAQPHAGVIRFLYLLFAAVCIGLAILAIITRMRLARFRANGPTLLYVNYILGAVLEISVLIFSTWIYELLGQAQPFPISDVVSTMFVAVLYVCLNHVYFTKRAHLFVN